jgi:GNAT superfamily N-acetyltransferase
MAAELSDVIVRTADVRDVDARSSLRSLWSTAGEDDRHFDARLSAWLAAEGDRRTTWLATVGGSPVGMASLFEYRRMPLPRRPDSRWGYVSNVFVRQEFRNGGIGSALLAAVIAAADERGYARLVLSPSARAQPFFLRAGFVVPDDAAGDDRLLVRRSRVG